VQICDSLVYLRKKGRVDDVTLGLVLPWLFRSLAASLLNLKVAAVFCGLYNLGCSAARPQSTGGLVEVATAFSGAVS
jgi:hypothetical protein